MIPFNEHQILKYLDSIGFGSNVWPLRRFFCFFSRCRKSRSTDVNCPDRLGMPSFWFLYLPRESLRSGIYRDMCIDSPTQSKKGLPTFRQLPIGFVAKRAAPANCCRVDIPLEPRETTDSALNFKATRRNWPTLRGGVDTAVQ